MPAIPALEGRDKIADLKASLGCMWVCLKNKYISFFHNWTSSISRLKGTTSCKNKHGNSPIIPVSVHHIIMQRVSEGSDLSTGQNNIYIYVIKL